jgi:hypothetical protein
MKTEKLYFEDETSDVCSELFNFLFNAKADELTEIELIEAIPDNETKSHIWCTEKCNAIHRSECRKSQCSYFTSISGRICDFRGKLYTKGKKVKFTVPSK